MSDLTSKQEDNVTKSKTDFDVPQGVFWLCLLIAITSASVALVMPRSSGIGGVVLLVSMLAAACVFVVFLKRGAGRMVGLFPYKNSYEAVIDQNRGQLGWLEAISEPALLTDEEGAPLIANQRYVELAQMIDGIGESDRPASVDRLFGSNPGFASPLFRLSKAARARQYFQQNLPPVTLGEAAHPSRFRAQVAPAGNGRVLWRLEDITTINVVAQPVMNSAALLIEDAPIGFFNANAEGRITYMNRQLREMLGQNESEKRLRIDDIFQISKKPGPRTSKKEGAVTRQNVKFKNDNGIFLDAILTTAWVTDESGEVSSRNTVLRVKDMGGSHSMDMGSNLSAPSSATAPSDSIFASAPFGVARLNGVTIEEATLDSLNDSFCELTDNMVSKGSKFIDLFKDEFGRHTLISALRDAVESPVDLKLALPDEKEVTVFVSADEHHRPIAAYVIDVTEQKQLEMRLAQGEKMQALGQMAGGVAHEFNNILTGVLLNCDKLLERHPVGDPSYFELNEINNFALRCAEHVNMLLAYTHKQTFRRDVLNISDFMSDFNVIIGSLLDERVKLNIVHGRDLPPILADKTHLETTLINLAANARDAILEHASTGNVTVTTRRTTHEEARKDGMNFVTNGDYLMIEVKDDGPGISPEILDDIFQPFFTTKEQGKGTGIGLATVYGFMKQSGGFIYPVSEVGKGTTFKLFFPECEEEARIQEAEQVEDKAEAAPTDLAGRGRILFVEDEEGVRAIAAQHLISRGYEVMEAGDGEEALELIEDYAGEIDLVISDVVLPGIDGPSMIKKARPFLGHARVVFVSGYAERDMAKAVDEERAVSFLPKPFNFQQLAARVKEELSAPARDAA